MRQTKRMLIVLSLIIVGGISYFMLKRYTADKAEIHVLDTLKYNEGDYNLMVAFYRSDTTFNKMLLEKIEAGDSAAAQISRLLDTPYRLRQKSGLKESDINGMIYSFYISKTVLDKFADIDKQLNDVKKANAPKNAEDSAIEKYLDSLKILAKDGKLKSSSEVQIP